MNCRRAASRWALCAVPLLVATALAGGAEPLAAQAILGLEKESKPAPDELETALDRLHDGWHEAALQVGGRAGAVVVGEALVRLVHEPLKLAGLPPADREDALHQKAELLRLETRVREIASAVARGELDEAGARAAAQQILDPYVSTLVARLGRGGGGSAGADGH